MILHFDLYGELEPLGEGGRIALPLEHRPATVAEALALLAEHCPSLQPQLGRCAVVWDTEVLLRSAPLPATDRLALLPPVAGG